MNSNHSNQNLVKPFLFTTLVNLVDYMVYFYCFKDINLFHKILISLTHILTINTIIFLIFFAIKKLPKFIITLYTIITAILFVIDAFLMMNFKTDINPMVIDIILNTNFNETAEFMQTFINLNAILIFIVPFVIYVCIYKKPHWRVYRHRKPILILMVIIITSNIIDIGIKIYKNNNYMNDRFNKILPIKLTHSIFSYWTSQNYRQGSKTILNTMKEIYNTHKANFKPTDAKVQNFVFIIGESAQRRFHSIYGYHLNTTPNLLNLKLKNNLVDFNNTISAFTSTNASLKSLMTFYTYESQKPWFENLSMTTLFKLNGYNTAWISNQETSKLAANYYYSQISDEKYFSNKYAKNWNFNTVNLDSILVEPIKQIREKYKNQNTFYVVHLMGSHSKYHYRYPKEFEFFTAKDINTQALTLNKKKHIAQYLNSIKFTDYIINEIFNIFKDDNALIVYVSDHGESLWEHNNEIGHGFISKFTCEIPLVFIGTDKFKNQNEKIWQKINQAKQRPFMSDNLIHTIAEISNIKVSEFIPEKSVINENYDASRKRIIEGSVDYEKIKNIKSIY